MIFVMLVYLTIFHAAHVIHNKATAVYWFWFICITQYEEMNPKDQSDFQSWFYFEYLAKNSKE